MEKQNKSLNRRNRRNNYYRNRNNNRHKAKNKNNNKKVEKELLEKTNPDIFNVLDHFEENDYSKKQLVIEDDEVYDNTAPIKKTDTYNVIDDVTEEINYNNSLNLDDTRINILNLDDTTPLNKVSEGLVESQIEDNITNQDDNSFEETIEENKVENKIDSGEEQNEEEWKEESDDSLTSESSNNERIVIDISRKKHISFKARVIFLTTLIIVFLALTGWLFYFYSNFKDNNEIVYNNIGTPDYRLYLKDNALGIDYLDKKDILNSKKVYLVDLIDKLDVDFDYEFNINEPSIVDFKYHIVAEIIINDINNEKELYSDKVDLATPKVAKMESDNKYKIKEKITDIDFAYYQSLANSYSNQFGGETKNYLKIYLEVQKYNDHEEKNFVLNDNNEVPIIIPLDSNAMITSITHTNLVETNRRMERIGFLKTKEEILYLASISIVLVIYFILNLYNLLCVLRNKKSIYEKYIGKVLKKYDKYIAESSTIIDLKKFDVIKIKNFDELMDVYNNLELPIVYCEVVKGQKSYFYIKNNKDIYLLQIKAADLEKHFN